MRRHINNKDRAILESEARAINAQIDWSKIQDRVSITVFAPRGFLWSTTQEPALFYTINYTKTREAVMELLEAMKTGYTPCAQAFSPCTGDDLCECDQCESADTEIEELVFS